MSVCFCQKSHFTNNKIYFKVKTDYNIIKQYMSYLYHNQLNWNKLKIKTVLFSIPINMVHKEEVF